MEPNQETQSQESKVDEECKDEYVDFLYIFLVSLIIQSISSLQKLWSWRK